MPFTDGPEPELTFEKHWFGHRNVRWMVVAVIGVIEDVDVAIVYLVGKAMDDSFVRRGQRAG